MAIVCEYYLTRTDGVVLNRTFSDLNMMIERDGVRYSSAVDPAVLDRQYLETDEPIETIEMSEIKQKAEAYDILMGEE